jgi:NodT family efflux transporter outer membrane factor (OMF) lipoprotein
MSKSPTLDQALARIKEARATQRSAGATVSGTASAGFTRGDTAGPLSTSRTAGLDMSWELDLFGGQRRSIQAAIARADATELDWHGARVSLAAEVASTYFSLQECHAALQVSKDDVASRQQTRDLVALQVSAGAQAPSVQAQAEASLADSLSTQTAQEGSCSLLRHQLATLTATPLDELLPVLATANGMPKMTVVGFEQLPAQVLAQRPDVTSAERSVAAASADIGVAISKFLPSVSLAGVINLNTSTAQGSSSAVRTWSFGPTVSLPILEARQIAAGVDSAHASYDEAYANWRSVVLAAVQEVEDALSRIDTSQHQLNAAQRAVDQYNAYFAATEVRYRAGAASLLELEDARRQTLSAKQALLSVMLEHANARVALYKAAGGGWRADIKTPSEHNEKPA